MSSLESLAAFARQMRRDIVTMTTEAGSGHPSSSLSTVEILTALYAGGVMRHDPQKPEWPDRDRFIMSKGHAAPALYAALAGTGYFPRDMLMTLRKIDSPLEGHPNMKRLCGVEASTGSLGQGLSFGLGIALAARIDQRDYRVYVVIGDGESDEGQIWEAAMAAAKYKVGNLICIVDRNGYQQNAATAVIMPALEPLVEKWMAFDWHVQAIDGHDQSAVLAAFDAVQRVQNQPQVIIAHTIKGKGVSYLENGIAQAHYHGVPLTREQAAVALQEIG
ncbi:MAG: transketolase [Chloroflexi bacterium]|nr:transketolase [Chloroflexota bacterium]